MFLDAETMAGMGIVLGQHFTEGELQSLADLLDHAAEACDYAAEDYGERADYEAKHPGRTHSEYDSFRDAMRGYGDTSDKLSNLAAMIRKGEEQGREDHPA